MRALDLATLPKRNRLSLALAAADQSLGIEVHFAPAQEIQADLSPQGAVVTETAGAAAYAGSPVGL